MKIPFAWLLKARGVKPGLLILGTYAAVYAGLSLLGHYQDNIGSLDKLGIITRGMSDREEWQPISIIVTRFPGQGSRLRANALGYLFIPLVLLDQHLCHPTKPISYGKSPANERPPVDTGTALGLQLRAIGPAPLTPVVRQRQEHRAADTVQ